MYGYENNHFLDTTIALDAFIIRLGFSCNVYAILMFTFLAVHPNIQAYGIEANLIHKLNQN